MYEKLQREAHEIYVKKRELYGDNFTTQYKKYGGITAILRLEDKMERLKQIMLENKQDTLDETMKDTLIDLSNYALMTIIAAHEEN